MSQMTHRNSSASYRSTLSAVPFHALPNEAGNWFGRAWHSLRAAFSPPRLPRQPSRSGRNPLNAPLAVQLAPGNRGGLNTGAAFLSGKAASTDAATAAQMYRESPWVYVAVSRIAEAAALVPLQVCDRATGELHPDHPLLRLLTRPNPTMSRFDLIEATVGSLELAGNAYWYLVGDARGLPCEIYPLPPERMRVVPGAGQAQGYWYEVDGVRVPLEADEVVHFRRWNPGDEPYGLSALEAARLAVASDRAMARWNFATFHEDRAVPAGIVTIKDPLTEADFERVKREWKQSYGSNGGGRKTAFVRGTSVEWQHIGLNHQDLDFLNGRAAHRDEILSIFGIPLGLLSENATEANAKVAERQFIERTLWPKLVRIAEKISAELLPFWSAGEHDCAAQFEDIRPTDAQARLEEIRTAYPILTINEIRGRFFGLPPIAGGDAFAGSTRPAPLHLNQPMKAAIAMLNPTPDTQEAASEV